MHKPTATISASLLAVVLACANVTASAQDRAETWEFNAGLTWSDSLQLDGGEGTGIDVDSEVGFSLGGTYNFTNRLSAGFGFSWMSPDYEATYLPDNGPLQTLDAELDVFSIAAKGTFNFLEGPLTPYVELGFGWSAVDSNIVDGVPVTGCWWDPWWGYICAPYYDTYEEDLTSWSGALGVRWDVNRSWGLKASYGILELNTSSRTEDGSLDMFKVEALFRY
jgi:opacity protein-like surface antigen